MSEVFAAINFEKYCVVWPSMHGQGRHSLPLNCEWSDYNNYNSDYRSLQHNILCYSYINNLKFIFSLSSPNCCHTMLWISKSQSKSWQEFWPLTVSLNLPPSHLPSLVNTHVAGACRQKVTQPIFVHFKVKTLCYVIYACKQKTPLGAWHTW